MQELDTPSKIVSVETSELTLSGRFHQLDNISDLADNFGDHLEVHQIDIVVIGSVVESGTYSSDTALERHFRRT